MADEIVAHAFSQGFHHEHVQRLAAYWGEALGGPNAYSAAYGDETAVIRMHSGNGEHDEINQCAIICFDEALDDAAFGGDPNLRRALYDYFACTTLTSMDRYHRSANDVPAGLEIPKWSWKGLQG